MVNKALFSSATVEWSTPQHIFDGLNAEFRFDLDVCATVENAKCDRFFDKGDDGLKQKWTGTIWMNPPYGRDIAKWMQKAFESSLEGATVVCLVPARPDTQWWHNYATRGEIRSYKGRLKFGGAENAAPFGSAVVVFRPPVPNDKLNRYGQEERTRMSTDLQMLTVKDAAAQLNVAKSTVYTLVKSGRLRAHRIGSGRGTIRISIGDLEEYLENLSQGPWQQRLTGLKHIKV